ncbi:hypothetical protein A3C37_03355 [Candidatus Peribacteria bacterium RIFCSPHIGHO2_02_FULL_53_20]|nr:MAG: hypothetical protein A3C37_03355 [Candidatus Peribacteria bacterium RIFCSPHIGHO2_02_FULL_53_20]OGJ72631.1 MAG: hypothetical protein A3G69_01790 [Candidatus Peribacteria bacterium RIFCSPLOWO2_12_FULL_53_10]
MSAALLAATTSPALAYTVVTMNQPDNGFFEGPSPEWATLHSTDTQGTAVHRQYHRDGATALVLWLTQSRSERGTVAYEDARRIFYQERNMSHRQFHTAPVTLDGLAQLDPFTDHQPLILNTTTIAYRAPVTITTTPVVRVAAGRLSRRTLIAIVDEQNRLRAMARL